MVNYVCWKDSEYRECKGTDCYLMKTATVFSVNWRSLQLQDVRQIEVLV